MTVKCYFRILVGAGLASW